MREVIVKHYQFDELSDAAKERAREWWRDAERCDFGAHGELMESAETAAKLIGVEFNMREIKLMGGGTRQEPDIRWSGFYCQGDGASFTGRYEYRKGAHKAVRKEFPKDYELHSIADRLLEIQKDHGYKLCATIYQSGHYVHEHTMTAGTYRSDNGGLKCTDDTVTDIMRDFARWIYHGLRDEYEYRMSDEQVDDSIKANEYEFLENGSIA